ncbi:hypothetical protein RHMOL_Rhmol06G0153500 [Rhododendron molle]|uniref:Uncharacterized protein n=1 Tax=Rhododendron molle TaxID=49168 RepID=A0ACC0NE33_RHOML|nr:hypothetical protein RHMOL_Rhmol06G0153500 [Rhododendron molle]
MDTSSIIKNGVALFELLDNFVEEIGEENVIQVVTDSASAFVLAGELLMDNRKKLIWSPCAAHCIDFMLKDIGRLPVHHDTITKAKTLTVYIYRHTWILNLMRKHTKNYNLAMLAVTRYCLKGVLPLVKVLRLVDGDAKPAMGYIYEAMDRAKEQIEKKFNKVKRRYATIWKIVDERWALQLHRPLHAAAYFLNPRFHYDASFEADEEVRLRLYMVIERMYPGIQARLKLDAQMDKFHNAVGPRNLQNDKKGKRKFVGEENDVEIIDDDVEEEIEEEEEEYIGDDGVVLGDDLEDDDDLYDIAVREE